MGWFKRLKEGITTNTKNKKEDLINEIRANFLIEVDKVERFNLDSYNQTNSFELIAAKVNDNLEDYNIIFSSLGPKTSAIPIYKVNRLYPQTALCYLPCKEFNKDYSKGIHENDISYGAVKVIESSIHQKMQLH